ncbi:sulfur carrier protein ThiS [Hydrocarboniclastica marina]|uniref:Sulfur carrier protein ThiS n=1 Tax=Hydrocarboniclastica marina TaxID=2259620 RepID=A0A4P7XL56_9ALTE|nr:sulfur carrier protein ThiS [Hydrocarboniclastica marina]MAL97356.1 hypothetical protein [Alteromonadaceae bacterium]QCF27254.1 sulfur carrier protein ThiS [Hydrocarboniclastica marina]
MNITVNGEVTHVPDNCSVDELIEQLCLSGRRLAVEVNQDIVPRSRHQSQRLAEGDVVEVVHAIGGG